MRPTVFERESFIPDYASFTFVCTSKDSEIQHVSIFARTLYSQFLRNPNGTNGIRKRVFVSVCTSPTFVCTSKGSETQRFQTFGNAREEVCHF